MFIVWGRRAIRRKRGWVAEYCPQCAEARAFQFREHRMIEHLYFIPIGRGKLLGHSLRCVKCKIELDADPLAYPKRAKKRPATIEMLVDQTNPDLPVVMAQRLERQEAIRNGLADAKIRRTEMIELMTLMDAQLTRRFAHIHLDAMTVLGGLLIAALGVAAGWVASLIYPPSPANEHHLFAILIIFAVCVIAVAILALGDVRRFYKRKIRSELLRAWAKWNSDAQDVEAVVKYAHATNMRLRKYLKANEMVRDLANLIPNRP
jgi:hypothetical protein